MPPYVLALAMEDSSNAKTPDTETPPQPQPTNGTLKRHHQNPPPPPPPLYKECLKNHAAAIGGLALDGCGEFMSASLKCAAADPASLKCAACGCHRNFHRRELEDPSGGHFISFHHPHRLPPPLNLSLTPSPTASPGQSPPPPAAPHMLLALSSGEYHHREALNPAKSENPSGRKRFRTKFSQTQKEKMQSFAEKLGWKLHKSDERSVEAFCNEVGVGRGVLKVWMHNNKHSFGKRDQIGINNNTNSNNNNSPENGHLHGLSFDTTDNENLHNEGNSVQFHVSTNGSSSSS